VSAVHASILLPSTVAGPLTPLLESLMLLLPAMYLQMKAAGSLSDGQRVAFEPLIAVAAVIDKILGDAESAPSMVRAVTRFLDGEYAGAPAEMLAEICHPLFAAFLPSHSQLLAQVLTRLLNQGPLEWEEPIMLAVAYALQHPQSPSFVDHFHLVLDLCVGDERAASDAAVYCLSSAMRAAARAGDQLTSQGMANGRPFDEIANIKFYESEERELEQFRDVTPAVAQMLAALRS